MPFKFVNETAGLLNEKGFGHYLNESDYSYDIQHSMNKTGVALFSMLDFINYGIDQAWNATDYNLTMNYVLQADIWIIVTVLRVSGWIERYLRERASLTSDIYIYI